jgi:hypothetical protein
MRLYEKDPKTHAIRPLSGIGASKTFFGHVFRIIKFIWPIFSSLLIIMVLSWAIIGVREGWTFGNSLYFTFITGFTIGYGDITPHYPMTKILAVILSGVGFFFTGILVAISVQALSYTIRGKSPLHQYKK